MRLTKTMIKQLGYDVIDIISFLVFVGGIILFVRFFIFHPYSVVGKSMLPTFKENDFIIVDKLTPKLYGYERGEIIVFIPPEKDIPYIKRVIGIPGDFIKIQSGNVTRCVDGTGQQDCTQLSENYLGTGVFTETFERNEFLVQPGGLFVMGDNRPQSTDSRACFGIGCIGEASFQVPFDHIIGKVFMRVRPNTKRSSF